MTDLGTVGKWSPVDTVFDQSNYRSLLLIGHADDQVWGTVKASVATSQERQSLGEPLVRQRLTSPHNVTGASSAFCLNHKI
jgi:hypothetical protein